MVKGMNKRVIVVKSPDPKVFEQAIFIVREDFFFGGKKEIDVLKEAEKVADDYLKSASSATEKLLNRIHPAVFSAAGAVLTGLLWLTIHLLGY